MNDLKARWVKALRSGRYKQTRDRLSRQYRGEERNCCLGVLCRVARARGDWREQLSLNGFNTGEQLQEAVGMDFSAHERLTTMNDAGRSFSDIADWIEENL